MMVPAYKREAINRMGARLRSTLKRCEPQLPDSLRLMTAQIVKEGILRGLQGYSEIYPGMKKMASWGGCSERQAQRNVRALEAWGVITPVADQKGGKRSTRYWVEPEAIIRAAMVMEANPHPDLMAEIRDMMAAVRGDARGDIQGRHVSGHVSPGIYNTTPTTSGFPQRRPSQDSDSDLGGGQ